MAQSRDQKLSGLDWGGYRITEFYQPSCAEFAQDIADGRREKKNLREFTPLPGGWEFVVEHQLKINLPRSEIPRFRRIYGYVGNAQTTDSEGTIAPMCFQVIAKLNFRYGDSEFGYADSFYLGPSSSVQ